MKERTVDNSDSTTIGYTMDQLLALLKNGNIELFNNERPYTLDFFAEDLSGLSLQGVDFSGANLEKADLSDSNLEGANLSKARLNGADLTNTNMNNCNLSRAKLEELYAETSSFDEADLRQAIINEAEFHSCSFVGAKFNEVKGRDVVFKNNTCTYSDFSSAKLNDITIEECSFEQAFLDNVHFAKSNISQSNFTQASLHKALFAASNIRSSLFDKANLSLSNWNQAIIDKCTFDMSNLTRADLTGIDLTTLDLSTSNTVDIHADLGFKPILEIPEASHLFIEMPWMAMNKHVLFSAWVNTETEGSFIRFTIFDAQKKQLIQQGSIPSSPSIVQAGQAMASSDGFVFLCFEMRPSNVYAIFYQINLAGECTRFGQIPISYTTDFQTRNFFSMFALRKEKEFFELYVLGRNEPKLHVHQLRSNGEFNHSSFNLSTAEGLITGNSIFAYTRGGAVCSLSARGVGTIFQPPKGFPGRFFRTTSHKDQLFGTWLALGEPGVPPQKGVFASGFEDDSSPIRFHNRETVQSSDIIHDGRDIWLAYCITPPFEATEIWIAQMEGTAQYPIPQEALEDEIDYCSLFQSEGKAYLVVSLINGTLQVFQLTNEEAIPLGTVQK